MNFMKSKGYIDAKDYAGECEPIVIIAKGQSIYIFFHLFNLGDYYDHDCSKTWKSKLSGK